MKKTVLFVIPATGYNPEEYKNTKEVLEDSGVNVLTVSDVSGSAIAEDETTTRVDMTLDEVNMSNYDGVFFFGGPGTELYLNNKASYNILRDARKRGKIYGAIQVAPRVLARAGVLEDREATGWNEDSELEHILEKNGAEYQDDEVVVSKKVVTAVDSDSARNFAFAIKQKLEG